MEYHIEANKIIEKFKKENNVLTAKDQIFIERIEGAINAIVSAEEQMKNDAEKTKSNGDEQAGYGFIWSRLGDKKMHPGITIIEKQKSIISHCLKEINYASADPKKKQGTLGDLMKVTGGKKRSA